MNEGNETMERSADEAGQSATGRAESREPAEPSSPGDPDSSIRTADHSESGDASAAGHGENGSAGNHKPRRRRRRRRRPGTRRPAGQDSAGMTAGESAEPADPESEALDTAREGAVQENDDLEAALHESAAQETAEAEILEEEGDEPAAVSPAGTPARKSSRRRRRRKRGGTGESRSPESPSARTEPAALSAPVRGAAETAVHAPAPGTAPEEVRIELDLRSNMKREQAAQKLLRFPGLDTGRARKLLIQFMREEMERLEATSAVIGLSGGLNSAVAAGLAVEALGRDRVHLVHFVENDKGSQNRSQADMVARSLQCGLEIQDTRAYLNMLLPRQHETLLPPQKRRLMRERTAALFEICDSKSGRVLIGTLDKTKWLLGLGVEGGTLEYAFNPLGDLYHNQVRELAKTMGVPREIIEREQRADFGDLGLPEKKAAWSWQDMDYYLYQMVDAKIALSYLLFLGLEEEKLRWIYRRLRDTFHQRKLAPVAEAVPAYALRGNGGKH